MDDAAVRATHRDLWVPARILKAFVQGTGMLTASQHGWAVTVSSLSAPSDRRLRTASLSWLIWWLEVPGMSVIHLVMVREEEGQGRGGGKGTREREEREGGGKVAEARFSTRIPSHYEHIASPHFAKTHAFTMVIRDIG